jgi:8-oxo-dGTP diphosphatase
MNKINSSISEDHGEDTYHLGIKALIQNPTGQILLLKVNPAKLKGNQHGEYWDVPGGRVQRGSSVEQTLARELEEETGLTTIKAFRPFAMILSKIRIPLEPHDVGLILSVYLCEVGEIAGDAAIKLSDEHVQSGWFSPGEAASLLRVKYPTEFTDKIRELESDTGQRTANLGCEAYIVRGGRLLLGLRKGGYGSGTWGLPGGHLEFMESASTTVVRELAEEAGLQARAEDARLIAVTDDVAPDSAEHHLHLTFAVEVGDQEPRVMEPEFCAEWRWFPLDDLPVEIFPPHAKILRTLASGRVYSIE